MAGRGTIDVPLMGDGMVVVGLEIKRCANWYIILTLVTFRGPLCL